MILLRHSPGTELHHNTIRYRLSRIKAILFPKGISEQEFYARLSLTVRLYLLNRR